MLSTLGFFQPQIYVMTISDVVIEESWLTNYSSEYFSTTSAQKEKKYHTSKFPNFHSLQQNKFLTSISTIFTISRLYKVSF